MITIIIIALSILINIALYIHAFVVQDEKIYKLNEKIRDKDERISTYKNKLNKIKKKNRENESIKLINQAKKDGINMFLDLYFNNKRSGYNAEVSVNETINVLKKEGII